MKKKYPSRAANVPVTQKMLYAVRDDLDSSFKTLKASVRTVDAKIEVVDAKVDAHFHQLSGQIHQMKILVEEQNAKNNIVLDGLTNLFERQERVEAELRRRSTR